MAPGTEQLLGCREGEGPDWHYAFVVVTRGYSSASVPGTNSPSTSPKVHTCPFASKADETRAFRTINGAFDVGGQLDVVWVSLADC